jgi:transposase
MSIMESVGRKKHRPRRRFTAQFKADIVEACRRGDRTVPQVCRDFELTESAVRGWLAQADIDTGKAPGLTSSERTELDRLRRDNERLRADNEILKRATAFFDKETR